MRFNIRESLYGFCDYSLRAPLIRFIECFIRRLIRCLLRGFGFSIYCYSDGADDLFCDRLIDCATYSFIDRWNGRSMACVGDGLTDRGADWKVEY